MSDEWVQVGTVEILRDRVYPIDPYGDDTPLRTFAWVDAGTYPLYRRYDCYRWLMTGRINERHEKIGDGLFAMHSADNPVGLPVQFPSRAFGRAELFDLMAEDIAQHGPNRRLRFALDKAADQ